MVLRHAHVYYYREKRKDVKKCPLEEKATYQSSVSRQLNPFVVSLFRRGWLIKSFARPCVCAIKV